MIKIFLASLLAFSLLLVSCGGTEGEDKPLTYEEFWAMSGEEQLEYKESFDSPKDFYAWYDAAKAEYEAAHPGIDAGDGEINLGEMGK